MIGVGAAPEVAVGLASVVVAPAVGAAPVAGLDSGFAAGSEESDLSRLSTGAGSAFWSSGFLKDKANHSNQTILLTLQRTEVAAAG